MPHFSKYPTSIRCILYSFISLIITSGALLGRPPNIIYILADDMGYADLSCYGQEKFQTPQIDRLAKEGMRFTQHYAGSTVCAPSRSALMTGLHTGHTPIRGNKSVPPEGQVPLDEGIVTIPQLLSKAGYTTGMFGKWGLGYPGSVSDPMVHFDTFYGYNCQSKAHDYYDPNLWRNDKKEMPEKPTYSHDLIMQAALDFIKEHQNEPFFCYIPVAIPHAAMQAPDEELHAAYRKLYPQFEDRNGSYGEVKVTNPVAAFRVMMEHLDQGVGQVLDLVQALNLDEKTIIMFTSDNGPHWEGGHHPHFWQSSGIYRGHKRDLYEGGIRIPFLVRWPGVVKPGTESDHISAFWDMLPTFCDITGLPIPSDTDGISIFPTLEGRPQPQHEYLYWEFTFLGKGGKQAIRKGDFKAIRLNVSENRDAPIELYNLASDPSETTDIAEKHPDIIEEMKILFRTAHTESERFPLFPEESGTEKP